MTQAQSHASQGPSLLQRCPGMHCLAVMREVLLQDLDAAEQENRDFWGALATVAQAQVATATRQEEIDRHAQVAVFQPHHSAVCCHCLCSDCEGMRNQC